MSGAPERDRELAALSEYGRRVSRVDTLSAGLVAVAGIAFGFPAYFVLREIQVRALGIHIPMLTGALAYALPIGVIAWLPARIARPVVLARRAGWIRELSELYEVPEQTLREIVDPGRK
jgi:hypothetical protein